MHCSDEVSHIGGELLNDGVVEALDVLQQALVLLGHKVDGHSLAPETAGAPNAVQVVLGLGGQVVVDHQGHLHTSNNFLATIPKLKSHCL